MDLIIKGMDMPKSCFECRFYQSDMDYCEATGTDYPFLEEVKLKDCPLVEVPPHHGRLIDADKVLSEIREIVKADTERGKITFAVDIFRPINNAPTIIDAEE